MIATLLRIGLINLRRDRVAQAMTFLLPILFFSIFATVFGNQRNPTRKITVAIVDEDRTDYSKALVAALGREGGLALRAAPASGAATLLTREQAEALVKAGDVPVAVVLPKGLAASPRFSGSDGDRRVVIQLLADVSDPVAPQMVQGLLQKASFTAAPKMLATEGMQMFEKYSGPLTPEQRRAFESWANPPAAQGGSGALPADNSGVPLLTPVELVNVLQPNQGSNPTVSYYAAGIGVMFLLFSCSGGAGTLLDEQESGTLGRLVGSRAGVGGVLSGKWLYLLLLGAFQLCVMFGWGALVFRLPLIPHLTGFAIVTLFTAAAAAAFGVLLATICRTRAQLSGISTIIILSMSAVGGSMFPRFLMGETMQRVGLVTFNAWALDAYLKVFWRQSPLGDLWPQLVVLTALTGMFLLVARVLARRWETA